MAYAAMKHKTRMRIEGLAYEDARKGSRHRRVSEFFCGSSHTCTLCGLGMGRNHSRAERKAHEMGDAHTRHFAYYCDRFPDCFDEVRKAIRQHKMEKNLYAAHQLCKTYTDKWTAEGASVSFKAEVFDAITHASICHGLETATVRSTSAALVKRAYDTHVRNRRRSLLVDAATAMLGAGRGHDAYSIGFLCASYL